ncbi:hypothetical protein JD844_013436 [Phrynosoma platyrhinos]|uniref:C-type lectin domain-containing protein n=1 Tax=Phrynosoma platyrhinos TaxID=52577 RepID=A0ABQ7TL75_PHRPL|nr:hypothetical protein JD844_013436 [Phrynosoma platyrhinos]
MKWKNKEINLLHYPWIKNLWKQKIHVFLIVSKYHGSLKLVLVMYVYFFLKDFLLRYKTSADHWIGLQRDIETEPWKWVNGTLFNNWFQIRGGGECAYLNYKGAASSFCTREEPWICSKPVNRCQKSTF